MGPEIFAVKIFEWVITDIINRKMVSKAKEEIMGNEFQIIGNRALNSTIKGNLEYTRILNLLRENGIFEVNDATELDENTICNTLLGENRDICHNFLNTLKQKYIEIVFDLGNKNPLSKLIQENILLLFLHERPFSGLISNLIQQREYFELQFD